MPADLTTMNFDELEEHLHHHDSIEAGDEMLRRLRAVGHIVDDMADDVAELEKGTHSNRAFASGMDPWVEKLQAAIEPGDSDDARCTPSGSRYG